MYRAHLSLELVNGALQFRSVHKLLFT